MTTLTATFVEEGKTLTQDERLNGRYIDIQTFGISETAGIFDETRNIDNINPMWVNIPISGTIPINPSTQQLNLTIPPNVINPFGVQNTSNKNIKELYLFAITQKEIFTVDTINSELIVTPYFYNNISTGDSIRFFTDGTLPASSPLSLAPNKSFYAIKTGSNRIKVASSKTNALSNTALALLNNGTGIHKISKYFLFCIGQFNPDPLLWVYTGAITLRIQLVINNLSIVQSINFTYTQATEINDHNLDPNAHPYIQSALNRYGYPANPLNLVQKGQPFIFNPVFHISVTDKMIVYKNVATGKFYPALATTGDISKVVGVADITDNLIRTSGVIEIPHSIPINQNVYLSDNTAGSITSNVTPIRIGMSLGNNLVLLQIGSGSGGSSVNFLNDLGDINFTVRQNRQTLVFNSTSSKWENQYLAIDDLADVDTISSTPVNNNVLAWNSTLGLWKPKALNFNELGDTNIVSPTNGQTLRWNGTKWVNINYGVTVNSNNYIETINFGAGFNVVPSGSTVNVTYSGGGSGSFLGLSDVDNSYPSDDGGIVVYNNYSSNTNPEKVKFIGHSTLLTDLALNYPDGLVFSPVYKSVINIPLFDLPTFPTTKTEFFILGKSYGVGAVDVNAFSGMGYFKPVINIEGSGITGLTSGDNNFAEKIIFGSGLSGTYSSGVLTINSTVPTGLGSIQPASSTFTGSYPLIYDTGSVSGIGKIRGLSAGTNISIEMRDDSNNITSNVNDAVFYRINGLNLSNIANTGSLGAVGSNSVLTPIKDITSASPKIRGIRGTGGIQVKLEVSGSNENIVIDGSGISGGSTSGLVLGGSYNVSSTGLNFQVSSDGQSGISVDGQGVITRRDYALVTNNVSVPIALQNFVIGLDLFSHSTASKLHGIFRPINLGIISSSPFNISITTNAIDSHLISNTYLSSVPNGSMFVGSLTVYPNGSSPASYIKSGLFIKLNNTWNYTTFSNVTI